MREIQKTSLIDIPSEKDIEKSKKQTFLFMTAIVKRDLEVLETLLHENFTYFDTKTKWQTLKYFKEQFNKEIPYELETEEVGMFFCNGCQPGNSALMFHHGYFPIVENDGNVPKSLTLAFKGGLISDLTLCYGFCNAEKLHEIAIQN